MMSSNSSNIAIFDSGFGALAILKHLKRLLPFENFIYFADALNSPYGDKTKEEIVALILKAVDFLKKKNIKLLVLACNTACVNIYPIRNKFQDVPIFEILTPSIKRISTFKNIGIMATSSTVESKVYDSLILQKNKEARILSLPCPALVPLIEEDKDGLALELRKYLTFFKTNPIDALLLACTHYILIKAQVKRILREKVEIIDPSLDIAQDVVVFLNSHNILSDEKKRGSIEFITSGNIDIFKRGAEKFLGEKIDEIAKK